ncbi:MAG: translation elongation factor Ts [bacterium]
MACETDFVVKNEMFAGLTDALMDTIVTHTGDVNNISELPSAIAEKCEQLIQEFVGKIGENTKLADVYIHAAPHMFVYTHPGDKLVSIVYYNPTSDKAEGVAKQVALQIAAMNPEFLSTDTIPAAQRDTLKAQFVEEVAASGKPADIVEKIVAGKLDKAFAENVLLEQAPIWDDTKKVKDFTQGALDITSFVRIAIGA